MRGKTLTLISVTATDRNQYGGSFLVGRIFRLARLIKATRYVSTFEVFASAFRSKKVELATALTLTMGLCLVIATVMFVLVDFICVLYAPIISDDPFLPARA
jgi:Na+/proline symporter